jgi:EAL domain-containing protein (putative c-di-GMP-specific phosphodiesterase class I)
MGHALGLEVTAEGVETEAELMCLRELHCDRAQGWYFGHPVPSTELSAILEANERLRPAAL